MDFFIFSFFEDETANNFCSNCCTDKAKYDLESREHCEYLIRYAYQYIKIINLNNKK